MTGRVQEQNWFRSGSFGKDLSSEISSITRSCQFSSNTETRAGAILSSTGLQC